MLIHAASPRAYFDVHEHPKHIYAYTLRKEGVSDGLVSFSYMHDIENGEFKRIVVNPTVIELSPGMSINICVIPFWTIFERGPTTSTYVDSESNKITARAGNHRLAKFCAPGFYIALKSAFRQTTSNYVERVLNLHVNCTLNGGGLIRLDTNDLDIKNSTFDPWAPEENMEMEVDLDKLRDMYRQLHRNRKPKLILPP